MTGALPALVTAGEDLAPETLPAPRRQGSGEDEADRRARRRPISTPTRASFGAAGSPTWVEGLETDRGRARRAASSTAISTRRSRPLVGELAARGLFAPAGVRAAGAARGAGRRAGAARRAARPRAIWVVAELFDGAVRRVTLELLAKARRLADERGGDGRRRARSATTCAGTPICWRARRRARARSPTTPRLASYATEPYAAVLTAAIAARRPDASCCCRRPTSAAISRRASPAGSGSVSPATASTSRSTTPGGSCSGSRRSAATSSRRSSRARVPRWRRCGRACCRSGRRARAPSARDRDACRSPTCPRAACASSTAVVDPSAARAAALDEADVAVGVGLGIGGPEALPAIEALAAALGGAPIATTRDVVDKGWLPRQHQVGITGRAIAPRFYFAIGIRGASEHMVGVRRAGTIVVIDRNPQAPIFAQADLGIVADWAEAVPRLTRALASARALTARRAAFA